jgi:hypothetical protein
VSEQVKQLLEEEVVLCEVFLCGWRFSDKLVRVRSNYETPAACSYRRNTLGFTEIQQTSLHKLFGDCAPLCAGVPEVLVVRRVRRSLFGLLPSGIADEEPRLLGDRPVRAPGGSARENLILLTIGPAPYPPQLLVLVGTIEPLGVRAWLERLSA